MQKFYIHKDNQSQGPFSVNELIVERISRETMVWFEGAEHWKRAVEIEELKHVFKSVPPPFERKVPINPPPLEKSSVSSGKEASPRKKSNNNILFLIGGLIIVCLIVFYFVSSQQQSQDMIHNQLQDQNMMLQDQEAKIQEQQMIEERRLEEENARQNEANEAARKAEIESLKYQYDEAVVQLRAARLRLDEVREFQLLRTMSEKEAQVERQLEVIRSWENEVSRLQNELRKY